MNEMKKNEGRSRKCPREDLKVISINALRITLAFIGMTMGLLFLQPPLAHAGESSSPAQANAIPAVESVTDTLAFITWTTQNPGGTILHNAIVQYGKDPNHLDSTAESPTRINPAHSEMVFRVRIHHLEPDTTYYYKVYSEQANGIPDPATSVVSQFTTRSTNQMNAAK
jgi:phosphodiesterase/alkaline phosphatase D-like protein